MKLNCLQTFSQKALEATVLDFKNCCIEDQNMRKHKINGNLQDIAKMINAIQTSVKKSEELDEKMCKMYQYAKGIAAHNEKWIKNIEEGLLQLRQKEETFRNLMEEDKENMEQYSCSQSKLHDITHSIMKLQLQYETKNIMARVKARFFPLLRS
ncbi:uncharacterized protein [Anabrus simplex]|uniref:uncharacterized protein n=1 Tax=Anabrus simplex TaxID=316456 RepID=UPI0034DCC4EF